MSARDRSSAPVSRRAIILLPFPCDDRLFRPRDRVRARPPADAEDHRGSDEFWTLTGRTQLWAVIWQAGLASTWFGTGFDAARNAILEIFGIAYQAHNQYFAILVETGYVGLIAVHSGIRRRGCCRSSRSRNLVSTASALYILAHQCRPRVHADENLADFPDNLLLRVGSQDYLQPSPRRLATPSRHATLANTTN